MQLVKGKDLIIYDDILDKKWLFHLDNELDNSESWGFNCSGGLRTGYPPKPLYRFWGITLFKPTDEHIPFINNTHEGLINELFKFLDHFTQEHFPEEKFLPHILHCNGQTIGQDGDAHQDMTIKNGKDCNYTLMIMVNNNWKKEWGGEFEIMDDLGPDANTIDSIEYVPGRVIWFNGKLSHRGLAPLAPNVLRKTIVFKLEKL